LQAQWPNRAFLHSQFAFRFRVFSVFRGHSELPSVVCPWCVIESMRTPREPKANPHPSSPAEQPADWLTSAKAKAELKIDSCDLMHHRLAGKLEFRKWGNAFFYSHEDVRRLKDGSEKADS